MLAARHVAARPRDRALSVLPLALNSRVVRARCSPASSTRPRRWSRRRGRVTDATGSRPRALRRRSRSPRGSGREDEAARARSRPPSSDVDRARRGHRDHGRAVGQAVLYNGLGRLRGGARRRARRRPASARARSASNWALAELVEAAARTGRPSVAAERARAARGTTRASGTDWALGIEARSRALLSEGEPRTPLPRGDRAARADTRPRRSSPARICSTASGCAARGGARRRPRAAARALTSASRDGGRGVRRAARRELLATGETARKRTVDDARRADRPGGADRPARRATG